MLALSQSVLASLGAPLVLNDVIVVVLGSVLAALSLGFEAMLAGWVPQGGFTAGFLVSPGVRGATAVIAF